MKTLLKLYSFESVHNKPDEKAFADWLEAKLKGLGSSVKREGDNLYHLSGNKEYPFILSAHLDQIQTNGKGVHWVQDKQGHIRGYNKNWQQTSLGADDKNGIWIILKAVELYGDKLDYVISAGEEVGCVGIKHLEDKGILDVIDPSFNMALVLDRRGNHDMLKGGSCDTYCSTLAQDLCNYLKDGFVVTTGSLSDTATLCKHCESVNISTAYEKAHTAQEHTDFNRLEEIKNDILSVLDNFAHYPTEPKVYLKGLTTYSYGGYKYAY